jgi:hypothetical protein
VALYVDLPDVLDAAAGEHQEWLNKRQSNKKKKSFQKEDVAVEASFSQADEDDDAKIIFGFVGGSIFESSTRQELSRRVSILEESSGPNRRRQLFKKRVVVMMNSFLQHLAIEDSVRLIRDVVGAVQQPQSPPHEQQRQQANEEAQEHRSHSPATTKETHTMTNQEVEVLLLITELVVPSHNRFNSWAELTPMARVFSAVLSSFTKGGEVRTADEYHGIGLSAECRSLRTTSLFPMPANVFAFNCSRGA